MATDLGKVGIVMKGAWSSSATYEVLDAVSYNNGLYIAKQAVPANTDPTNTTYWQPALVADKNNLSTVVPLVSYTSADNYYTFPSDGYLYIRCNAAGSKLFVVIQGANRTQGVYIELEYGTQAASTTTFVKQGMTTYIYSSTGNISYSFCPLT